jgi:REP element-mobilizing transposase RayT
MICGLIATLTSVNVLERAVYKREADSSKDARVGRRKVARPIACDRLMHIVYRSSKAKGEMTFHHPKNRRRIEEIVGQTTLETGVELKRFRNVGNHFHFLVRARTPEQMRKFLRLLPQRVALAITGAKKGSPHGKFFDETVFSRTVNWGYDYANVEAYLLKNAFEEMGYSAKQVREFYNIVRTHPVNRMLYLQDVAYRGKPTHPPRGG